MVRIRVRIRVRIFHERVLKLRLTWNGMVRIRVRIRIRVRVRVRIRVRIFHKRLLGRGKDYGIRARERQGKETTSQLGKISFINASVVGTKSMTRSREY